MNKHAQSFTLILLVLLAGCSSVEPKRSGLPIWDFEHDEVQDLTLGAAIGALLGGGIGGIAGAVSCCTLGAFQVGGVIQDGIKLTPPELNHIISTALAPTAVSSAPMALSLNPTPATQNVSPWTISESNEGQIITDWKAIQGKKAGVLWWEKTFECETRHLITIKRSYQSSQLTNFTIVTEVRERPNVNYPWTSADPELGRASFENLKNILLIAVRAELNKRKTTK